jgi:hypothetical protein
MKDLNGNIFWERKMKWIGWESLPMAGIGISESVSKNILILLPGSYSDRNEISEYTLTKLKVQ